MVPVCSVASSGAAMCWSHGHGMPPTLHWAGACPIGGHSQYTPSPPDTVARCAAKAHPLLGGASHLVGGISWGGEV